MAQFENLGAEGLGGADAEHDADLTSGTSTTNDINSKSRGNSAINENSTNSISIEINANEKIEQAT